MRQSSDDPTGDTRFRSVIGFSDGTSSVLNLSGLMAFLDSNPDIKSMIKMRNKGSVLFDSVNLTRNNTDLDLQ